MPKEINHYLWEKFGLTYDAKKSNPTWGPTHALVPTPVVIDDENVAIFSSFVDRDFRGRIGRVDINFSSGNPTVANVQEIPVLDLGPQQTFSQYGVGMGTFWPPKLYGDLYFVGFDRPTGFKFKAFSGKAIWDEAQGSYTHTETMPMFGEDFGGKTIVGIHDIFEVNGLMNALISIGSSFEHIEGKDFPRYQVHLAQGQDLDALEISTHPIIPALDDVYRIGRPRITRLDRGFEILVTAGSVRGSYLPEAYFSEDLVTWTQKSTKSFTEKTINGFDDLHQCYLSRFTLKGEEWIVYNGNNMGLLGFGFAKGNLIEP